MTTNVVLLCVAVAGVAITGFYSLRGYFAPRAKTQENYDELQSFHESGEGGSILPAASSGQIAGIVSALVVTTLMISVIWVQQTDIDKLNDTVSDHETLLQAPAQPQTNDTSVNATLMEAKLTALRQYADGKDSTLLQEIYRIEVLAASAVSISANLSSGSTPTHCWDLNNDGNCTLPGEDRNNDNECTVQDCQPFPCWDLDMDYVCDVLEEDKNQDGQCTQLDCHGANGQDGSTGAHGSNGSHGFHCWDLNENRVCDLSSEDINKDGNCTVADCTHYANGSISLSNIAGPFIDMKYNFSTGPDVRLKLVNNGSLAFYTGGDGSLKEAVVIDEEGNLAIGIANPSYRMHVQSNSSAFNQIRGYCTNDAGRAGLSLFHHKASSDLVIQHASNGAGFIHNRDGNLSIIAHSMHIFSNDNPTVEALHIPQSGQIGLRTRNTGPYDIHAVGSVRIDGEIETSGNVKLGSGNIEMIPRSAETIGAASSQRYKLFFDASNHDRLSRINSTGGIVAIEAGEESAFSFPDPSVMSNVELETLTIRGTATRFVDIFTFNPDLPHLSIGYELIGSSKNLVFDLTEDWATSIEIRTGQGGSRVFVTGVGQVLFDNGASNDNAVGFANRAVFTKGFRIGHYINAGMGQPNWFFFDHVSASNRLHIRCTTNPSSNILMEVNNGITLSSPTTSITGSASVGNTLTVTNGVTTPLVVSTLIQHASTITLSAPTVAISGTTLTFNNEPLNPVQSFLSTGSTVWSCVSECAGIQDQGQIVEVHQQILTVNANLVISAGTSLTGPIQFAFDASNWRSAAFTDFRDVVVFGSCLSLENAAHNHGAGLAKHGNAVTGYNIYIYVMPRDGQIVADESAWACSVQIVVWLA